MAAGPIAERNQGMSRSFSLSNLLSFYIILFQKEYFIYFF